MAGGGNVEVKEVKKEMLIGDILAMDMTIAPILMASGMHCIGCPASSGETLEEAVGVHGLDADESALQGLGQL